MSKKLYFGTNLKMYKTIKATEEYLQTLVERTKSISRDEIELFVIPSYTTLSTAVQSVDRQYVKLGAQNMCWEDEGQFTGEISPVMLKELELDLVMIGHSERRHVFGETDIVENQKVVKSLASGFTTLLCIGETADEKKYGISEEVLRTQLKVGLYGVDIQSLEKVEKLWIAYEPVWSIGVNGTPASVEYAQQMHVVIKETLHELFGESAKDIPVLYGGSVNYENSQELILQDAIDGLFIGRSAWDAEKFDILIRNTKSIYENR